MPNHNDNERMAHRLDELEEMIRSEWPEAEIFRIDPEVFFEPQRIRIEISRQEKDGENRMAIIFRTGRPLMTDAKISTGIFFNKGIHLARNKFETLPNRDKTLQGTVIMNLDGIGFERYSGRE